MEQNITTSKPSTHKNPSRAACENTIRRILITEVLEHGSNTHFKTAADFMKYFESLYPASDALTKQVQRAVKSMDMPKDDKGYFIVNKTTTSYEQEKEIRSVLSRGSVQVDSMDNAQTVFLSCLPHMQDYLMHLIQESEAFRGKYITMVQTFNGILIYTNNRNQLVILLNSLTN